MNIRVIASFVGVLCLIPAFQGPNNEVTSQVALCMYTFASSCFASACIIRPQLFWTNQLDFAFDQYHLLFSRLIGLFIILSIVCLWYMPLFISFRISAVSVALFTLFELAYVEIFIVHSSKMFKYMHASMIALTIVYFSTCKY